MYNIFRYGEYCFDQTLKMLFIFCNKDYEKFGISRNKIRMG